MKDLKNLINKEFKLEEEHAAKYGLLEKRFRIYNVDDKWVYWITGNRTLANVNVMTKAKLKIADVKNHIKTGFWVIID